MLQRLDQIVQPSTATPQPPTDGFETLQEVTREIAFEGGWSQGRADRIRQLFDALAPDWHTRGGPDRLLPLQDALERGGVPLGGTCIEAGSGVGLQTPTLAGKFAKVISFDLSATMLAFTPAGSATLVQADSAWLPFRDGAVEVLVCVNMFLFPSEHARVVSPGGAIVFASTGGAFTPIYLSPEDVLEALPGEWDGVTSVAGRGTWTVARRSV